MTEKFISQIEETIPESSPKVYNCVARWLRESVRQNLDAKKAHILNARYRLAGSSLSSAEKAEADTLINWVEMLTRCDDFNWLEVLMSMQVAAN